MIIGNNITLRPIVQDDLPLLFEWINNRETVCFNSNYKPVHFSDHLKWFESFQAKKDHIIFGINENNTKKLIGAIQLINIHPIHQNAELIIRIGDENARDKGYGKETVTLILDFAWKDLNLHKVILNVFADNVRAREVYKKCGFIEEGYLKEAFFIDGQWKDVIMMGKIRS